MCNQNSILNFEGENYNYLEKHIILKNSHKFITEQTHLSIITMDNLYLIKNISKEFENKRF